MKLPHQTSKNGQLFRRENQSTMALVKKDLKIAYWLAFVSQTRTKDYIYIPNNQTIVRGKIASTTNSCYIIVKHKNKNYLCLRSYFVS